jgi:hypothetical protein
LIIAEVCALSGGIFVLQWLSHLEQLESDNTAKLQ